MAVFVFGFVVLLVLSAAQVLTPELNRVHSSNSATQGLLQQHRAYSSWTVHTPLLMEVASAAESIFHQHCNWGCTAQGIIQLQWLSKCGAGAHRWSTLLLLIPVASQLNKILPMRSKVPTWEGKVVERKQKQFWNQWTKKHNLEACKIVYLKLFERGIPLPYHQVWSSCWFQKHLLRQSHMLGDSGFEKNKH